MTDVAPNETETAPEAKPQRKQRMVVIELLKNYRPAGEFEIVGWRKPAVKRKNAGGKEEIVEPEEFIKGEAKPPAIAGTGFEDKLWAGTHIRVPYEEAKRARELRIAEVGLD